jgi:hypothetical protein
MVTQGSIFSYFQKNTAMRSFFFCLTILLLGSSAYAQEADSTQLRFGTFISFYNLYPDGLSELNQQLDAAERLDLNDNILGVSLGFTQRFADQNSYLATKFSFFSATDMEDSDDHTRLRIWEISTTGHYDLIANDNWLGYPYLGVGANIASLTMLTQTPGSFQSSLSSPASELQRQQYVTDLMLFANLGMGIERALRFPEATLYLGFNGGYRFSFSEPWSLDSLRYFTETDFSTQGWMFEIKLRSEITDPKSRQNARGMFQFFQ